MRSTVRIRRLVGGSLVGAVALAALPAGAASAKSAITISGSTSVAPLAAKLARQYVKETKGKVAFRLLQGGSDVGVSDVARGRVTLGMSSRDPKPSDPGGLVFYRIARDGICIVTNKANKLEDVSQAQVQQIFGGSVRDWGQVPGAGVQGTINVFIRTAASGTQDAFQKIFLGSVKPTPVASQRASNGLVQQAVKNSPTGIGYVSLAFAKGLNALSYKGVACNLRNSKAGTYGGVRNFWLVSRGNATGAAIKWIKWILHDADALRITGEQWVPLK